MAGKHKLRINPFEPQTPEDAAWMKDFLLEAHENFKNLVKERRKSLDLNHKTVFEADVFSGANAAKIGLIDGLHSDLNKLIKDRFGEDVAIKKMEAKSTFPFGLGRFGAELNVDTENLVNGFSQASIASRFKIF